MAGLHAGVTQLPGRDGQAGTVPWPPGLQLRSLQEGALDAHCRLLRARGRCYHNGTRRCSRKAEAASCVAVQGAGGQ